MVSQEESTILIKADATKLPEFIEVSIEGRPAGEHVLAGQVELPSAVELAADPELLIVNVSEEAEMDTESEATRPMKSRQESRPRLLQRLRPRTSDLILFSCAHG